MDDLYRSVYDLPEGARLFLKSSLYFGGPEYDGLDEEQQEIVDNCDWPDDIPDDILNYAFSGYSFVPEDFVAMAGDNWDLV